MDDTDPIVLAKKMIVLLYLRERDRPPEIARSTRAIRRCLHDALDRVEAEDGDQAEAMSTLAFWLGVSATAASPAGEAAMEDAEKWLKSGAMTADEIDDADVDGLIDQLRRDDEPEPNS